MLHKEIEEVGQPLYYYKQEHLLFAEGEPVF